MDAYDLFKRLGSGAKFDFKRFRSDAERLKLVRPKTQNINPVKTESQQDAVKKELSSEKIDERNPTDNSSSESSDTDSSSESDSDSDSDSSNQESATEELRLLGDIKSKGDNSVTTQDKSERKHKKTTQTAAKLADLKKEEINHIRNVNRLHVYGTDIPEPCESFDKLCTNFGLHSRIVQNIQTVGYVTPTPIQIQAIPVMLHGRDLMACAPTGSGKTAAFILPILHQLKEPRNGGIRALVLAPTRELAKQTYREFQRLSEGLGFRVFYIDKVGKDTAKLKAASKKIDILVSTPNRLVYIVRLSPSPISLSKVHWLVVDESDKLFEDGKTGFRDQLAAIYKACDGSNVRRAMFSATFASDVEEWCKLHLDNVVQVYVGARNTATQTIEQSLMFVGSETGKLLAIRDIIRQGIQPPVLVFVQSKERAKELFHELIYDGMNVDVIQAERTQLQRDNVVKCFRSGKIWILICTELMGRGMDFKGVNLVINYDFPNSAISYIHRIGRTGRAGRSGKAITFFTENDSVNLRSIANVMRSAGCPVPDYMLKINKPNKIMRKQMSRSVPERPTISTEPEYVRRKARYKSMLKKQKAQGDKTQQSNHSKDRPSVGKKNTDTRTNKTGTKRKKPFESNSQSQFKKKKFDGSVKQTDGKFHKHKFNGNTKLKSKNRHDKSSELRQGKRTKKKGFQKNTG